jgi:PAS domain S-box-containing protein
LKSLSRRWREDKSLTLYNQLKQEVDKIGRMQPELEKQQTLNAMSIPAYQLLFDNFSSYKSRLVAVQDTEEQKISKKEEEHMQLMVYVIIAQFVIAFIMGSVVGSIIITNILKKVRYLKHLIKDIAKGDLPENIKSTKDEMNSINTALSELVDNLKNITNFAQEVGKGKFESDISVFNNQGSLGKSLAEMRESLKNVADEEKTRSWFNSGVAKFSEILRNNSNDIDLLCEVIISELVKYLKVNQGAIFIVGQDETGKEILEMKGCYAYDRKKHMEKTIIPGEGLVGQVFLEKAKIFLTKLPDNYINITSGLGQGNPKSALIVPLQINEEIVGVIELASFSIFNEHEIGFTEKVGESIASTISGVKINLETKKLLQESQLVTEQLRAQEEEMRQNSEELEATQEEIHRQMSEMKLQKEMFESLLSNVDGIIYRSDAKTYNKLYISEAVEKITGYKKEEFINGSVSLESLVLREDIARAKLETENAIKNHKEYHVDYRIKTKNDEIIWLEDKGRSVYDEDGNVCYLDGVMFDITAKKTLMLKGLKPQTNS